MIEITVEQAYNAMCVNCGTPLEFKEYRFEKENDGVFAFCRCGDGYRMKPTRVTLELVRRKIEEPDVPTDTN